MSNESFTEHPFLSLRGLCKDSYLDQIYLPQNSPINGETTFYGTIGTYVGFQKDKNQWKMNETLVHNITAVSKEISGRFMLGKQNWTVEGDSKKCNEGKPYNITLKLTGCKEDEFTCDDGQCVKIEKRCNQQYNCRDKSDEINCKILSLDHGYNKRVSPILSKGFGSDAVTSVSVRISMTLLKVVAIEEADHTNRLQFQITLEWKENRVTYHNLKKQIYMNALSETDINMLWLPLVVFTNTDQQESTRLGENWEWKSKVSVRREGEYERSGFEMLDETELFRGEENSLVMVQSYTHAFQCVYQLEKYPFDTQVNQVYPVLH